MRTKEMHKLVLCFFCVYLVSWILAALFLSPLIEEQNSTTPSIENYINHSKIQSQNEDPSKISKETHNAHNNPKLHQDNGFSPSSLKSQKLVGEEETPTLKAFLDTTGSSWPGNIIDHEQILDNTTSFKSGTNDKLTMHAFPDAYKHFQCNHNQQDHHHHYQIQQFPIVDNYPDGDAYLPWIHDVFPNQDGSKIHILLQNRRRCNTGKGNEAIMKKLKAQMALFQPISVKRILGASVNIEQDHDSSDVTTSYRLASHDEADPDGKETRFLCRFKVLSTNGQQQQQQQQQSNDMFDISLTYTTLSQYSYNPEYISYRKGVDMFLEKGKDTGSFWLSSLEIYCPVPSEISSYLQNYDDEVVDNNRNKPSKPNVYLDIATLRTPVRDVKEPFFYEGQTGDGPVGLYDEVATKKWGIVDQVFPSFDKNTRWENMPICSSQKSKEEASLSNASIRNEVKDSDVNETPMNQSTRKKPFTLVACTWTSAIHNRRGDARTIQDGAERLKEWIAFHELVGFNHIVVYDNSAANSNTTDLKQVTDQFPSELVTHVDWPCKICNNNRPNYKNPGERSSQYSAEASCRSRFGPMTDWMAFMDPDEYFVPMGENRDWKDILTRLDKEENIKVLKFRSTRARPRLNLMVPEMSYDGCPTSESVQAANSSITTCLGKSSKETFLRTYNCEYIKSPKPERFQRAMKQIYRPDFVLNHFVHYSTVTSDLAMTKEMTDGKYSRKPPEDKERFSDEINEGVLVHAKTTTPDETLGRTKSCEFKGKKSGCPVGISCPDDLPFDDKKHKDGFQDQDGNYCNCWLNRNVEDIWLKKLDTALAKLIASKN